MVQYPESISAEEMENMEIVSFDGPIIVVTDKDEDFAEAIDYLSTQKVIGFDTETKPCFQSNMPRNKMALLQLSGADKAYLFRLHTVGIPSALAKILANKNIIKVGAAIRDDIRGLNEYNKFIAGGFVDLQMIAESYGIKEKSVKKLSAIIIGKRVSKAQQLSNWEAAVLSGAQLKYAAIDAWVCREMYLTLMSHK